VRQTTSSPETDVNSLWRVARIHNFLAEERGHLNIVLNRFRKIPGVTSEDVEQATNCKILWNIPNAYFAVFSSINRGVPIVLQRPIGYVLSDIAHSYHGLAAVLGRKRMDTKLDDGSEDRPPGIPASDPKFKNGFIGLE
jgi:hypothetical protein